MSHGKFLETPNEWELKPQTNLGHGKKVSSPSNMIIPGSFLDTLSGWNPSMEKNTGGSPSGMPMTFSHVEMSAHHSFPSRSKNKTFRSVQNKVISSGEKSREKDPPNTVIGPEPLSVNSELQLKAGQRDYARQSSTKPIRSGGFKKIEVTFGIYNCTSSGPLRVLDICSRGGRGGHN